MQEKEALQKVAARLGFEFVHYDLKTIDDLESAIAAGLRDNVSAFFISGEILMGANLSRVVDLVTASGKPSFGTFPDWGRAGLLMSYSTDNIDGVRRAGIYAGKFCMARSPAISQSSRRPSLASLSISRPPKRSALPCLPPCWHSPTRSSSRVRLCCDA